MPTSLCQYQASICRIRCLMAAGAGGRDLRIKRKEGSQMSSSRLATLLAAATIAAGLAASPSRAQSQPDAARMAAARELVEASGGASMGQRVIDQMLDTMVHTMREQNPSAAGSFEQVMRKVLS